MKHSIVLFLSTFATTQTSNGDDNLRHTKYKNIEEVSVDPKNPEVDCVQTNESAVRFLQAKLAKQGECIDKIYSITSKGVKEEKNFVYQGKQMCVSHVELFKKRLGDTIGMQEEQFEYIDYDEDEPVDTNMKALLGLADKLREKAGYQDNAKVHFDMTGGMRTVTQMMTSLLYLLKHSKVNVGHVLYSDFTKNTVDDMSELFDINTLVAGIEEFTNYGSTRSLQDYFKGYGADGDAMSDSCRELLDAMNEFSMAVGLCIPYKMVKAVKVLQEKIALFQQSTITSVKESTFKYMIHTIETEYKALLQHVDNDGKLKLAIIHWCIEKDLLQQALTLSTEWLPEILFDEKIYYHNNLKKLSNELGDAAQKMKRSLQETFIMIYKGNNSDVTDYYDVKNKAYINFDDPMVIIKFIRKNIGDVRTQKDVDVLLEGLGITETKLYTFIYTCVKAYKMLVELRASKREECEKNGKRVIKKFNYITNIHSFKAKYPNINQYVEDIYNKQQKSSNILEYETFLAQQSETLGKLMKLILLSFSEKELVKKFPLPTKINIKVNSGITEFRKNKILQFYRMLEKGEAKTDLLREQALQFIVEYHYIKQLRNTINHTSEEDYDFSSQEIISRIKDLIHAVEDKRWDNLTVIDELKEIIDFSTEK